MENVRLILLMALVFILLLIYQAWQEDYGPQNSTSPVTSEQPAAPTEVPQVTTPPDEAPVVTAAEAPTPAVEAPAELPRPAAAMPPVVPSASNGGVRLLPTDGRIMVETDVLKVELDVRGGDIRRVDLIDYTLSVDNPEPMRLMNDALPHIFVLQSGLLPSSQQQKAPSHQSIYQTTQSSYRLSDSKNELLVELIWSDESGLSVSKIYRFERGSYTVQVSQVINNNTGQDWL
ncbi:MAG: membrane protein insertase YidC, partial [Pseudomonadota bacterium]